MPTTSRITRLDPTRTTLLRKKFIADMMRRFKTVGQAIYQKIVGDDALGLILPEHLIHMAKADESEGFWFTTETGQHNELSALAAKQIWFFKTSAQKVEVFRDWLQQQIDANILSPAGGVSNKPWTAPYIESVYKKAMLRAYTDLNAEELVSTPSFYKGGQAQFLLSAFGRGEAAKKIELLFTRTFEELRGVTNTMSQQMSRILASGLAQGKGPAEIARSMSLSIGNLSRTRAAVIARTEIIHAHAEGQLDAFEALGVEGVTVMAEWSTAGDSAVCKECAPMEGVVMTVSEARELIPRHPNCRCSWIPADRERKEKGQSWGKRAIESAIGESVTVEVPSAESVGQAASKSGWTGSEFLR